MSGNGRPHVALTAVVTSRACGSTLGVGLNSLRNMPSPPTNHTSENLSQSWPGTRGIPHEIMLSNGSKTYVLQCIIPFT